MECSISQEEFERLQVQLLELRTKNYTLIEENRKISNELRLLQDAKESEKGSALDVFTPKKLSDFKKRFLKPETPEAQPDIRSQEESLRRGNENLQREFQSLCETNHALQKEIDLLREAGGRSEPGEISAQEFEILSIERRDLMQLVEQLRQQIDQFELEKGTSVVLVKSAVGEKDKLAAQLCSLEQTHDEVLSEKEAALQALEVERSTCEALRIEVVDLQSQLEEERQSVELQTDRHKDGISKLVAAKLKLSSDIENQIQELQEKENQIRELQLVKDEYRARIEHLEEGLAQSKAREEELKIFCDLVRSDLKGEFEAERKKMMESFAEEKKGLLIEVELVTTQCTDMETMISSLKQDLVDAAEDKKIEEKKGASALRDLKRQLLSEKKRVENLQERLKDLSPNDTSQDGSVSAELDRYSVSSWSVMSGDGTRALSRPKSTRSSSSDIQELAAAHSTPIKGSVDPPTLDTPVYSSTLELRLSQLEEEKMVLEERIRHLESTGATVAEELLRRGKLIERYCMDGGRNPAKSNTIHHSHNNPVLEKIAGKMNGMFPKKDDQKQQMLRLLEETLTKNMHLQDNIETLVQEIQGLKAQTVEEL